MTTLLLHLDGKLPNIALMRISARLHGRGDDAILRRADNAVSLEPRFGDPRWSAVYASTIFERTRPLAERVLEFARKFRRGDGDDFGAEAANLLRHQIDIASSRHGDHLEAVAEAFNHIERGNAN